MLTDEQFIAALDSAVVTYCNACEKFHSGALSPKPGGYVPSNDRAGE